MLPTITWQVDPNFITLPRKAVVITLGVFAAFSFVYGLVKKANDQLLSGLFFAGLAAIVHNYMPETYGIRYYSVLFVGVFLGGHAFLKWQIVRGKGPAADANDFIIYGVLGVLVGARLGHVLFYDLDKALEDPAWVLKIWTGGLASHGAVLGLIVAMFWFTKVRGIPFLEGADRFSFSAALGATLVRVGNLLNSEIVGKKTDGTWGFRFPHFPPDEHDPPLRHPSQLYEIALGLLVLAGLFFVDKRLGKEKRPRGAMISAFFVMYFCGRFIVEFFKEYDGISPDSPLRMGQILSIPGILLGTYGLYWSLTKRIPAGWPHDPALDEDDEDEEDEADDDEDEDEEDEADDDEDEDEEDEADDEAAKQPARKKKPASATKADAEKPAETKKADAEKPAETKKADAPPVLEPGEDPDVDDEFDAEGRLKRRERQPEE
jgi:phosphatidylglycerol:prolipoprotein diacylglycerol transferase